jgi:hypothetical protein
MTCRDLQTHARHAPLVTNDGAHVVQLQQDLVCSLLEQPARPREGGRIAAAIHQIGADPLFERLDAAAESGLSEVPDFGRAREALGLGERDKILDPLDFHAVSGWSPGDAPSPRAEARKAFRGRISDITRRSPRCRLQKCDAAGDLTARE